MVVDIIISEKLGSLVLAVVTGRAIIYAVKEICGLLFGYLWISLCGGYTVTEGSSRKLPTPGNDRLVRLARRLATRAATLRKYRVLRESIIVRRAACVPPSIKKLFSFGSISRHQSVQCPL